MPQFNPPITSPRNLNLDAAAPRFMAQILLEYDGSHLIQEDVWRKVEEDPDWDVLNVQESYDGSMMTVWFADNSGVAVDAVTQVIFTVEMTDEPERFV